MFTKLTSAISDMLLCHIGKTSRYPTDKSLNTPIFSANLKAKNNDFYFVFGKLD
jgi:hypothetical protein